MRTPCRAGFTLVELLVVITIIGILIALLLPAVQSAREAARRIQCANHFKQVGVALHNYHASHNCFPPGMIFWTSQTPTTCGPSSAPTSYKGWGWATLILPYLEQQALYDQIEIDSTTRYHQSKQNRDAGANFVDTYLCPSDPQGRELLACPCFPDEFIALTNMSGVADSREWTCDGSGGGWDHHYPRQLDLADGVMAERRGCRISQITDGTSNTLIIGEITGGGRGSKRAQFWITWDIGDTYDGINSPLFTIPGGGTYPGKDDAGFCSYHPGGCHFAMADGSVQFLTENIASAALAALTTRAGGDLAGEF